MKGSWLAAWLVAACGTERPLAGDVDGDGFGADDCDANDPLVYPGAPDLAYDGIDQDCDRGDDYDQDRDGFRSDRYGGDDCDDFDDYVWPGQVETCNETDDDCDGGIDEDAIDRVVAFPDRDGDGIGDPNGEWVCPNRGGYVAPGDDCDDDDVHTYPGAPDFPCDGIDNDCDPATPEVGAARLPFGEPTDLYTALAGAYTGELVELCEGVLDLSYPRLVVERDSTVRGIFGADATVLLGGMDVSAGSFVLDGVTIEGGLIGVQFTSGGSLRVEDSVIRGTGHGGIVAEQGGEITVVRTTITGNGGHIYAGGIHFAGVGYEGALTLEDATITGNSGGTGGGLSAQRGTIVGIGANVVSYNTASSGGGAWLQRVTSVSGVSFVGNTAEVGGGVVLNTGDEGVTALTDVTFDGNSATLLGGGLAVSSGAIDCTRCAFVGNHSDGTGGAFHAYGFGDDTSTFTDSTFTGNDAEMGGALWLWETSAVSVGSDWGAGGSDNLPDDVALGFVYSYAYDGVQDFTCVTTGGSEYYQGNTGSCE